MLVDGTEKWNIPKILAQHRVRVLEEAVEAIGRLPYYRNILKSYGRGLMDADTAIKQLFAKKEV